MPGLTKKKNSVVALRKCDMDTDHFGLFRFHYASVGYWQDDPKVIRINWSDQMNMKNIIRWPKVVADLQLVPDNWDTFSINCMEGQS
jgi:hypothetical protein